MSKMNNSKKTVIAFFVGLSVFGATSNAAKISELNAFSGTPDNDDEMVINDYSDSPVTRRIDLDQLFSYPLESGLIFEGATADANETTLYVKDPTADNTVDIEDASGTLLVSEGGTVLGESKIDAALARDAEAFALNHGVEFSDASVSFSDGVDLGTDDFTVALWTRLDDYTPGTATTIWQTHSSGNNRVVLSLETDGDFRLSFTDSGGTTTDYDLATSAPTDGEFHHVAVTADRDANAELFIDGVSQNTIDISVESGVDIGNGNANAGQLADSNTSGALADYRVYNLALTQAQVQADMEGRVESDFRWSRVNTSVDWDNSRDGFTGINLNTDTTQAGSWLVGTNLENDDLDHRESRVRNFIAGVEGTFVMEVEYKTSDANYGGIGLSYAEQDETGNINDVVIAQASVPDDDTWRRLVSDPFTTSPGFEVFNVRVTLDAVSEGTEGTVEIRNFRFRRVGVEQSIAFDEGIGYQAHDNHPDANDGLLSTSGFTHRVPRTSGYVRDFALDANGAGTVSVVDGSRDILPDDAVITHVAATNQDGSQIAAGKLDVNRADGTNTATIGDNADVIDASDSYLIYPDLTQDTNDLRLELPDNVDAGMDNLDVRATYEIIQ